ncbi:hypothetical protein DID75_03205 [Candidatus Marinamargulisbacteria bacterium SCGC AG-410-N11]|nr:hypothetical protein DID75_03205 [Candidatus Marinamargulisbacteria bacterium SCGC AG-410-N11]
MKYKLILLIILTCFLNSINLIASQIHLEANLSLNGELINGKEDVTIEIIKANQPETILWSETFEQTPFIDGNFGVNLGSKQPFNPSDFSHEQLLYRIKLQDVEVTEKIYYVPRAVYADYVSKIDWKNIENKPPSSNVLFISESKQNVGINTSSANATLDINGTLAIQLIEPTNDNSNLSLLTTESSILKKIDLSNKKDQILQVNSNETGFQFVPISNLAQNLKANFSNFISAQTENLKNKLIMIQDDGKTLTTIDPSNLSVKNATTINQKESSDFLNLNQQEPQVVQNGSIEFDSDSRLTLNSSITIKNNDNELLTFKNLGNEFIVNNKTLSIKTTPTFTNSVNGLVPAPKTTDTNLFLSQDSQWKKPIGLLPNSDGLSNKHFLNANQEWSTIDQINYTIFSNKQHGLVPTANNKLNHYLFSDGNWKTLPIFAGKESGLVPSGENFTSNNFLNASGNWVNINTMLSIFNGNNQGLVPQPTVNNQDLFLRSDGQWVDIDLRNDGNIDMKNIDQILTNKDYLTNVTNNDIEDNANIDFSKLNITKEDITNLGIPANNSQLSNEQVKTIIDDTYVSSLGYIKTDTDTQLSNDQVKSIIDDTYVSSLGYIKTASNTQLSNTQVKNIINDTYIGSLGYIKTDTDTQLSDTQVKSIIDNSYIGSLGYIKTNTQLSETQVKSIIDNSEDNIDTLVSNNGFLTSVSNDNVADNADISFSKLNITKSDIVALGIPASDTNTQLADSDVKNIIDNSYIESLGYIKEDTQLSESEVDVFVADNGYLTSVSNGSVATDAAISFSKLNISKANIESLGIPGADTNTQLSESEVDGFVANNGYLTSVSNGSVATDAAISFSKLNISKANIESLGIPGADTNTQLSESEVDGFVANNGYLTSVSNDNVADNADISFSKLNITKSDIVALGIPASDTNTQLTASDVKSIIDTSYIEGKGFLRSTIETDLSIDKSNKITFGSTDSYIKPLLDIKLDPKGLEIKGSKIDTWGKSVHLSSIGTELTDGIFLNSQNPIFANKAITTPGADYAEYLPQSNKNEIIKPGDIISIKNGKITKNTQSFDQLSVISQSPAIVGNAKKHNNGKIVCFTGQVNVNVIGPVNSGDYIITNNQNNGIGKAISPQNITLSQLQQCVGQAWETNLDPQLKQVNIAIIPNNKISGLVYYLQNQNQQLKSEINIIKEQLEKINNQLNLN